MAERRFQHVGDIGRIRKIGEAHARMAGGKSPK
jgi:hypothetical protein